MFTEKKQEEEEEEEVEVEVEVEEEDEIEEFGNTLVAASPPAGGSLPPCSGLPAGPSSPSLGLGGIPRRSWLEEQYHMLASKSGGATACRQGVLGSSRELLTDGRPPLEFRKESEDSSPLTTVESDQQLLTAEVAARTQLSPDYPPPESSQSSLIFSDAGKSEGDCGNSQRSSRTATQHRWTSTVESDSASWSASAFAREESILLTAGVAARIQPSPGYPSPARGFGTSGSRDSDDDEGGGASSPHHPSGRHLDDVFGITEETMGASNCDFRHRKERGGDLADIISLSSSSAESSCSLIPLLSQTGGHKEDPRPDDDKPSLGCDDVSQERGPPSWDCPADAAAVPVAASGLVAASPPEEERSETRTASFHNRRSQRLPATATSPAVQEEALAPPASLSPRQPRAAATLARAKLRRLVRRTQGRREKGVCAAASGKDLAPKTLSDCQPPRAAATLARAKLRRLFRPRTEGRGKSQVRAATVNVTSALASSGDRQPRAAATLARAKLRRLFRPRTEGREKGRAGTTSNVRTSPKQGGKRRLTQGEDVIVEILDSPVERKQESEKDVSWMEKEKEAGTMHTASQEGRNAEQHDGDETNGNYEEPIVEGEVGRGGGGTRRKQGRKRKGRAAALPTRRKVSKGRRPPAVTKPSRRVAVTKTQQEEAGEEESGMEIEIQDELEICGSLLSPRRKEKDGVPALGACFSSLLVPLPPLVLGSPPSSSSGRSVEILAFAATGRANEEEEDEEEEEEEVEVEKENEKEKEKEEEAEEHKERFL